MWAGNFHFAFTWVLASLVVIAFGTASWILNLGFASWLDSPGAWAAIAFLGIGMLVLWTKIPYRIGLSTLGVTFRALGQTIFVPWSGVRAFESPARLGMIGVGSTPERRQNVGAFLITVDQARTLLRYPHRPNWPLSQEVLISLGLPATGPG